jgi:polyphenol oxidase
MTSTSRRSSSNRSPSWRHTTSTGTVQVVVSTKSDGDFNRDRVDPVTLDSRRRGVVDLPWTMLDEQHGTDVVAVGVPGHGDGQVGDVLVTSLDSTVIGIWVGDCAPVVIASDAGVVAAVHAGWRGLAGGVLDAAVAAIGPFGTARAFLGPCIGPCCYEFGHADLLVVAGAVGAAPAQVTGRTAWGTDSLDVPAAVRSALARHRIVVEHRSVCTGCDPRYFSHRRRNEAGRHVVAAWKEPPGARTA